MFDEFRQNPTESRSQHHQANLARLAEIQAQLKLLVQVRERLLKDLTNLKSKLETHRQAGAAIKSRAMAILNRLAQQVEEGNPAHQTLSPEDEQLLRELEASREQLERDVDVTERKLKIAQFEADTLAQILEELELQVAEIASDLNDDEDFAPHERH
ncbi:MAG: hypothetical protein RMM98_17450 [Acidobacteriota bacterium]|nr:hypothetical protein [Blastocatellia bacterium]MDW8241390.1 hypothetical protein [Acidobacteriota bacterium]